MGLLGIILEDERFYELAQEGAEVDIDLLKRVITIKDEQFGFSLNDFQFKLLNNGGVTNMYNKFGKDLFRKAMEPEGKACGPDGKELAW